MKEILSVTAVIVIMVLFYVYGDKEAVLYFRRTEMLKDLFEVAVQLGRAEIYLIPSILIYLLYRKKRATTAARALYLFSSVALAGILVMILKFIFGRYRPVLLFEKNLYGFDWLHGGYAYVSFPSGHTTVAFGAFVALSLIWPRYRYLFYLLAVAVGVGRVALTAHYPSDVIGGALLGSICALLLYRTFRKSGKL
jgi:membrane-associated phospholipid phosphatase